MHKQDLHTCINVWRDVRVRRWYTRRCRTRAERVIKDVHQPNNQGGVPAAWRPKQRG